jgi:NADH:ubiquinone oxidoreductase subunit 6 (subunit J)
MSPFPALRVPRRRDLRLRRRHDRGRRADRVLSHRIIRSVAGLALCCLGLAGLYYFLNSPFLALMEILIYIGAVCVTIIFGVMLSEPTSRSRRGQARPGAVVGGRRALVSVAIFWGIAHPACTALAGDRRAGNRRLVQAIGIALLTTYSLPFELISLVLLVAILGALTLARGGRSKS